MFAQSDATYQFDESLKVKDPSSSNVSAVEIRTFIVPLKCENSRFIPYAVVTNNA